MFGSDKSVKNVVESHRTGTLNFLTDLLFIPLAALIVITKTYWNANSKWGEIKTKLHFDIFCREQKPLLGKT